MTGFNDDNSPSLSSAEGKQQTPQLGGNRAVRYLVERLDSDDPSVRYSATRALAEIGDERALSSMVQLIEEGGGTEEIAILSKIGAPAVPHLVNLLHDRNWYINHATALALARIDPVGIETLKELASSDNTEVRWLARLGLSAARSPYDVPAAQYFEALHLRHPWIIDFAARTLGELNDQSVFPDLRSMMQDEALHIIVRQGAAAALAFMGRIDGIELLLPSLRPRMYGPWTGYEAMQALGSKVIPELIIELQKDDFRSTYMHILDFLSQLPYDVALPALEVALKSSSRSTRAHAASILGNHADPQSTKLLIAAMNDESSRVRDNAAKALMNIDSVEAIRVVIRIVRAANRRSNVTAS